MEEKNQGAAAPRTASYSESGAQIDGPYRYRLWRDWAEGPRVAFVMLNPSTADAYEDDPTIRRCVGYAKALGAGALDVVNLFALRSTDPRELARHEAPVGPDNDAWIAVSARACEMVICAWGAHGHARDRAARVLGLLRRAGAKPMCLRQTRAGHPAHPLYLPADLLPVPYLEVSVANAPEAPPDTPNDDARRAYLDDLAHAAQGEEK